MLPTFVLAAVLTVSPAPSPLAGCEVQPSPIGWDYACGAGLQAWVVEWSSTARATEMFRKLVDDLAPPGAPRRSADRRTLGGQEVEVVRIRGEDRTHWMALVPGTAGSRTLTCHAQGEGAQCAAILDALAAQPFGGGPVPAAKQVPPKSLEQVGGVRVPVPDGCEGRYLERGGGELRCTLNRSGWWILVQSPEFGEKIVGEERARLAKMARERSAPLHEDDVACRLAGRDAVCKRQVLGDGIAAGTKLSAYVEIEGVTIVGVCFTSGQTGKDGPCGALFALQ